MKKLILLAVVVSCGISSYSQNNVLVGYDPEAFGILATLFAVGMFMYFIITILKKIFDHRLKNKIVDKGISESVAQSILETKNVDNKYANVKWFAILAGIGIGLLGVNYTQPVSYHSIAIMAFSISLSFLGYYLFIRNIDK